MAVNRTVRIGEEIKQYIAMMLVRGEISDPRVKTVTIHEVRVTKDMQNALVFYSLYDDSVNKEEVEKGLKSVSGYIRNAIGRDLKFRYTPQLIFKYDHSLKYADSIQQLLSKIKENDGDFQEDKSQEEKEV